MAETWGRRIAVSLRPLRSSDWRISSSVDCAEGKGAGPTDGGVVRSDGAAACVACICAVDTASTLPALGVEISSVRVAKLAD
jgi:hypothetical protein